ncbi:MAG: hypothetical protein V7724_15720 [Sediminicola sp.]|tara:strand:- start:214 stop:1440 length:1227 start_codon:yes stop_codon:yes gene_type:complete
MMGHGTSLLMVTLMGIFVSCNHKERETVVVENLAFSGGSGTSLPYLFGNDGKLFLSWVEQINDSTAQLNYSQLIEGKWGSPKEIIRGTEWFVNWADFPAISENNGNLMSHILRKSSKETFAYDIALNLLSEGTSEWRTDLPLHTDGTKTEHGFVSAIPYLENSFFITWLDGREMQSHNGHGHDGHEGSMGIRVAEVSPDGSVRNEFLLDGKTCSCCQTTTAMTDNGPIVVYRDRTDQEIRDIAIGRRVNGQWTVPKPVHDDGWEINGCPVNGPKVDAIGNNVAVAWFTAANGAPKVKVAFSQNGGEDFSEPILVDDLALGRVDIELLDGQNALISWMATVNGKVHLQVVKVNSSGTRSVPIPVAPMDGSRSSGFPQMERADDHIYFAWTDSENGISQVRTAVISLKSF